MSLDHLISVSNKDAELIREKDTFKEEYLRVKNLNKEKLEKFLTRLELKFDEDLNQVFKEKEFVTTRKTDKGLLIKLGEGDVSIEIVKNNSAMQPFEVKRQINFKRSQKTDFANIVLSPVFEMGKTYLKDISDLTSTIDNIDSMDVHALADVKNIISQHKKNIELLDDEYEFKYFIHKPEKLTGQINQNLDLSKIIDRVIILSNIFA
ncbi:hypothetical protein MWMV2_MWMV2_02945 [Acinetobacter oleivorans]|nr:hypothetical protein MWMV3_MWMV3_02947 [Acinetobacter oleivorans]CAI3155111.1 hypothetical protein MWMV12_MWMV12_02945 [Acinetobacter oleivorans]CAI3155134.1 hypothetical protein MWMV13_MWMV13_02947 [Acinetobacter oleivorans]CAI3155150.1 hypothetical protein MWMV2_MWMV2_02945 [Acinetobacter oleivorans]CAI3155309.1 hypothetical protein MWMV19_MWMV19_02947 [Acinetobacter oleivorans]